MGMFYIEESDDMELADVALALKDAGFTVGAVRIWGALEEIQRLSQALDIALRKPELQKFTG